MKVLACLGAIASFFCASTCTAHHPAVTEGGAYVGGGFTFVSSGGDLFEDGGDRLTQIEFTPGIGYFVADGFGLGGSMTFSRVSQGDRSVKSMRIGPQISYLFDASSNALPFITGEVGLRTVDASDDQTGFDFSETGFGFALGGGVMFLPSEHLGIHMALIYAFDEFDVAGSSIDGNQRGDCCGAHRLPALAGATKRDTEQEPAQALKGESRRALANLVAIAAEKKPAARTAGPAAGPAAESAAGLAA